ncbi:MAG: hypothetical protein J6L69_03115 [Lachnospiraceae bacterium]|nr:hypothetical protein [Lachnospiraceae bacterium]
MNRKCLVLIILSVLITLLFWGCKDKSGDDSEKKDSNYISVITYENKADIENIEKILSENNMDYIIKESSKNVEILEEQYYDTIYLLGKNGYMVDMFKIDYIDISLKGTAEEREKAFSEYVTNNIKLVLEKSASIRIDDISLFFKNQLMITEKNEPYIKVQISLIDDSEYKDICEFIAISVGSESAERIIIVDKNNSLIYGDENVYEYIKAAEY